MATEASAEASAPRERVLALLKRFGWNATSFQVLEPGFHYWFDGDEACVAFVDTGSAWVAAGAPIAPAEQIAQHAARFVEAAAKAGRRACFFAVEQRFVDAAAMPSIKVGEQPVWNPRAWNATLGKARSLREQLRRARAKGATVRELDDAEVADPASPTRAAVDRLIARWTRSRPMPPMGFLVALHPFATTGEHRYFLAEQRGRAVGFLAVVPVYARGGWFLEDLLRDPAAPNGTAELLVHHALTWAAGAGSGYATLGLAPLAGSVSAWLRAARSATRKLYNFHGLYSFKARLKPDRWEPVYLAHPGRGGALLAVYDTLAAFASGRIVRFALRSLLRVPEVVVHLLAALLVPWTALLALAGPDWHPSTTIYTFWLAFDVALAIAMAWLGAKWRPWLATVLAAVITADAALTLAQAVFWNLPRAHGIGALAVSAIAVLAPTGAAALLWRSILARRAEQR